MPDDRYYNPKKIHIIFAISSAILLLGLVSLFTKDYSRKWKDYQRQFKTIEVEKSRIKLDEQEKLLATNEDYKGLVAEIEEAKKDYEANCPELESIKEQLVGLKAEDDIVQQKYRFTKAELDASKYSYEAGKAHHHGDTHEAEETYKNLDKLVKDLKLSVETSEEKLRAANDKIATCSNQINDLEKKERSLAQKKNIILRKLKTIDHLEMDMANQLADMIRDLPIIDLANPNLKIEQIVLKDIQDDVIFMNVPKVERCITCHLGVGNADYEDEGQPFKTHPNLELFVGKNSPHPVEEFGCTVCHSGRSRGTSFNGAAHSPSSEEQKKEWEEKYDYKKMDLWEEPMHPLPYVEAGCFKCHSGESNLKGAEKLNLGLSIIEKAGCYNCHEIDKYEGWHESGPDLTKIASKLDKEFVYKWIEDPKSFRHDAWMPSYFNQSNNSDPASIKRGEQEIHAIVHYLFSNAREFKIKQMPRKGDVERGEKLVKSIGCFACHQVQPEATDEVTTNDSIRREFGPNLIGLGSKTSKDWLFNWLKDPVRYHADTRMPNLRLTDKEAADITEYLMSSQNEEFAQRAITPIDKEEVDSIVFGYLKKIEPQKQAKEKLSKMTLDDKLLFAGKKLISQYGCYSCHDISGFKDAKPIGIELTEEGSKSLHKLDFGFLHINHTKEGWFTQKLKDPRIFDKGKELEPDAKLVMPNFYLSDEEIEATVTALMGFVKAHTVKNKIKPRTPENLLIEEGQKIVKQMNCQGCHLIEGQGMSIADSVRDWLITYEGNNEGQADTILESFTPPNLHGVGAKLNPEWLFNFLHSPEQEIRPWMELRMPTYNFNTNHLNTLVKYFNALDGEEFPFFDKADTEITKKEYEAAEKLFSEEYFGCTQCHVVGNKLPTGTKDTWAPNLALAKTRLKPEWLINWIKDPASLMPGTKMPAFFDPSDYANSGPEDVLGGDEDYQILMLRNYLMSIEDSPESKKPNPEPEPAPSQ